MGAEELNYAVINGNIVDGETRIKEVRVWEYEDFPVTVTFDEPVSEDDLHDQVAHEFIKRIHELESDPDFDYTEPKHFRGDNNISKALVEMFHICPFTTNQFSEESNLEYASSYPSKLRDRGMAKEIGSIGSKTIWALTLLGIKEALCLIGHPRTQEQMVGLRQPQKKSGLDNLFSDVNNGNDEEDVEEEPEESADE